MAALGGGLACTPRAGRGPAPARPLVFTHVTVVDVTDGSLHPDQAVLIDGSRIQVVGPASRVPMPRAAAVVEARGQYLIPGLWDMHVHLSSGQRYLPEIQYALYVVNGVTGIRSVNVPCLGDALRWRRAIAAGQRIGPRQVISGPALRDGDGATIGAGNCDRPFLFLGIGVPTRARAQVVVDSLKAAGADFLKVYEPSREAHFALAAAARRAGLPFGGHRGNVTLEEASDSGQRIIDHGGGGALRGICWPVPANDSAVSPVQPSLDKCAAVAHHLRQNGTWIDLEFLWPSDLTPEVWSARQQYRPDSIRRSRYPSEDISDARWSREHQIFALAGQVGLPILAGTDGGPVSPATGFGLQDVLVALVEYGLTPLAALQAATLNPARALGATDSLGTVEPGKLADLVLLDGNPLTSIYSLRQIRAVVANGRYFDRTALDAVLTRLARANSSSALLPLRKE